MRSDDEARSRLDDVADHARALLEQAGLKGASSTVTGAVGTNANAIVELASGERFVYRRYTTPGDGPYAPIARMRREAWLFEQLGTPQVLAPAVDPPALLVEFLPGEPLGDIAAKGNATQQQWYDTGVAFRELHDIDPGRCSAEGIEAERVDPERDLATVARRLDAVAIHRSDLNLTAAREVLARAGSEPRRTGVIHGDGHMWNVLAGTKCVLIDLERSALGDPDFDLAYFDGLRFSDGIGTIPDAFFDGYGRRPTGSWYQVHRLGIAATVVEAVASGYGRLAWDLPRAESVLRTAGR